MKALFVQIKCELSKVYDVASYIVDNVPEAAEIYSTSGQYDLLVKFELDDEKSFSEFVNFRVQSIPGIRDTYSLVAFKFQWSPKKKADFEPRPERLKKM